MGVNHRAPSWMLAITVHPLDLNTSHPFHMQNTLILSQGRPKSHSIIASAQSLENCHLHQVWVQMRLVTYSFLHIVS